MIKISQFEINWFTNKAKFCFISTFLCASPNILILERFASDKSSVIPNLVNALPVRNALSRGKWLVLSLNSITWQEGGDLNGGTMPECKVFPFNNFSLATSKATRVASLHVMDALLACQIKRMLHALFVRRQFLQNNRHNDIQGTIG